MSFALVLWFIIFTFLIGFWFWTNYIVLKQRKAWKFFANKKGLTFKSNGYLETPSMSGAIDGYKVSVFASEHSELDARSQRRLTAIEVTLHTGLPINSAIASGGMVPIAEMLDLNRVYHPKDPAWDDGFVVRTADTSVIEAYLTQDRLKHIIDLMQIDKAWVVILYVDDRALLRLDTPFPLDHPKKLDKTFKKMIEVAKILELADGEAGRLLRNASESKKQAKKLDLDEDLLNDDIGFELEDDEADVAPPPKKKSKKPKSDNSES